MAVSFRVGRQTLLKARGFRLSLPSLMIALHDSGTSHVQELPSLSPSALLSSELDGAQSVTIRYERFGAALMSAALLAFWGATTSAAECEDQRSSSTGSYSPYSSSNRDQTANPKEEQVSGDCSAKAHNLERRTRALDLPLGQLATGGWVLPDHSQDWSLLANLHLNRDGFFRDEQLRSFQLSCGIFDSETGHENSRSSALKASSEQPFAAANVNISSTGSPDVSINSLPISRSDNPPWADEVSHARQGLAKRLANLEPNNTKAIPWPIISKKGQQVAVRFRLAPSADFSHFMVDAVTRLGADPQAGAPSSGPLVRVQAYDSPVARHILILPSLPNPPASTNTHTSQASPTQTPIQQSEISKSNSSASRPPSDAPSSNSPSTPAPLDTATSDQTSPPPTPPNSVSIVVFQSLVGERTTEVEYIRRGRFTEQELDAIASGVKIGIGKPETTKLDESSVPGLGKGYRNSEPNESAAREKRKTRGRVAAALSKLESMGVIVYGADTLTEEDGEVKPLNPQSGTWGHLAGYEEQKQEIEDTILLALQRPEIYDRIARGTRREFESNRPRAILFDGPPGTGKTSTARVIAGRAGVPLLYVPLEAVASKYYGESERLLAAVFNAGKDFPNGCLVFLDEIDALATERDTSMHEATRRVLSVLLRQLDGFEPDRRTIVIAATNRKEDLDAALLSRFDTALTFGLPDLRTRQEIFAQYAQHLSAREREAVAAATDGMSGRDIRDICEQAERHWASKVIRDQVPQELPTVDEYLRCCKARRQSVAKAEKPNGHPQNHSVLAQQFA